MTRLERIIVTSAPYGQLIRRMKNLVLPGFEGLPLYDVIKFFFAQIRRVGINERAASISFNLLMAFPPLMIFFFTLIPYFPIPKSFNDELFSVARDLSPNENTYLYIKEIIDEISQPKEGLLSFGFLLVAFFSSNAMIGIMRSFDRSLYSLYKREASNFFRVRWTALKLTGIMVVLVVGTVLLLITQGALLRIVLQWLNIRDNATPWLISTLRWIVIVALFYYSIGLIYKYAPSVKKRWNIHTPGTVLATSLIILFTWVFSFWVNNFGSYSKIYGSIGTVLIMMTLIFFNALVLLIGFELNVSISHLKNEAELRKLKEDANS